MLLSLVYFSINSKAESPYSPVSLGAGRARVASNETSTQVLSNPATLIHAKSFAVGAFYQGGLVAKNERDEHSTFTITDNGDDIYAAGGFVYSKGKKTFDNSIGYEEERYQASFAKFIYKQLSLGTNINYYVRDASVGATYRIWDFDLGLLWNPLPDFAVGLLVESLLKPSDDVPDPLRPEDRVTVGVNYLFMPQFRLRSDLTRITDTSPDREGKWDLRTGLESKFDAWLVLRFGYELQSSLNREYLSAGFGLVGPRLNIDYAYRKNTEFSDGALHSVDFRLPF